MNSLEKSSVLIVDDEKSNLDVLNHILKQEYKVFVAKSGQAAINRVAQDKPDLILLDIIMPDINGYDVLMLLKESEQTRDIPVIFITALTSAANEEKGFILGAVDYITKPFNSAIVRARVKTHIQIVKQMRTIEKIGMIDALTNIPNRRSFDHTINIEWSRSIREQLPLSILLIDIDYFKKYNDSNGHPQGDVLLQALAKKFKLKLKRPADLVARLGGEEFIAILPNTELEGALIIAEEIRYSVEEMTVINKFNGLATSVTLSIGVANIIPSTHASLTDFIARADKALYMAKNSGRNRVCFL